MTNLKAFLAKVEEIADTAPRYRLGGCGDDGTCDCIGLMIGALRRAGGAWPGVHGSNYAARNEMETLQRVDRASALGVGMVVYKAHAVGEAGYALPKRYKGGADKLDYYHVGVVTSVAPLTITHCTGPGIVRDGALGKWAYAGWLRRVAQEDAEAAAPAQAAVVCTSNGGAVKLRAKPTKKCALYWAIPCGERVTILSTSTGSAGWWQVKYKGKTGYVLAAFLQKEG